MGSDGPLADADWYPCSLVVKKIGREHKPLHKALRTPSDDKVYIIQTLVDPHVLVDAESITLALVFSYIQCPFESTLLGTQQLYLDKSHKAPNLSLVSNEV